MGFVANYVRNLAGLCVGREPTRPLIFSYYVTHQCHLNCRYCSDGDGKRFKEDPIPELSTADAKRLISILSKAGDTLDVTGGEPLERSDLEELLRHARSVGLRTILNTKGMGLESRREILAFTDVLVLSVDTLDPLCLAGLIGRPLPVAQRILRAMESVLAVRRETGVKIVLSAVATPDNLSEVGRVLEFAMEHSLGFHLSPEVVGTKANPALRENQRYRELVDRALRMKESRRGVLGVRQYLRNIKDYRRFRCHPLLMPVVRPDGRLYYPCLEWKRAEIDLLQAGSYFKALRLARRRFGGIPACQDCCHIFCHMALSLLQRHPISALAELKHWRA